MRSEGDTELNEMPNARFFLATTPLFVSANHVSVHPALCSKTEVVLASVLCFWTEEQEVFTMSSQETSSEPSLSKQFNDFKKEISGRNV